MRLRTSTNIAGDIGAVARAAETTTAGVAATRQASIKLAEMSRELEQTVSHFQILNGRVGRVRTSVP